MSRSSRVFKFSMKSIARSLPLEYRKRLKSVVERRKWLYLVKNGADIRIELGSGNKRGVNGWTTVDFGGADIAHDLTTGIPLPDRSVKVIYSSHLFEHLNFQEILSLIAECERVLLPGGTIHTAVPNARLYIDAYVKGEEFKDKQVMHAPAICDTSSPIDQINYIAYMGNEHKYLFDELNLVRIFEKFQFRSVGLRDFDETMDSMDRKFETIYCVATK